MARLPVWLKGILLISAIALVWIIALYVVSLSMPFSIRGQSVVLEDLMTLLFGASSIALFLISTLFALFALVGWQSIKEGLSRAQKFEDEARELKREVRASIDGPIAELRGALKIFEKDLSERLDRAKRIEEEIRKDVEDRIGELKKFVDTIEERRIRPLETEMTARIYSILGYTLGENSIYSTFKIKNQGNLEEAVKQCQMAYDMLKDVRGKPVEFMALNNLIFYLSFLADASRSAFVLEESRRLLRVAQAKNYFNWELTACRAILKFSSIEAEKSEAAEILRAISESSLATAKERKEAKLYLTSFSRSAVP